MRIRIISKAILWVCAVAVAFLLVEIGCEKEKLQPDVQLNVSYFGKMGDTSGCCCTDYFKIHVEDTTGSRDTSNWYWLALMTANDSALVIVGDKGFKITDTAGNPHGEFAIGVPYTTDVSEARLYQFWAYRCDNLSQVGNASLASIKGITTARTLPFTAFSADSCYSTCCTPGYAYARAAGHLNNLIGAKALIKTRYGELCGGSANGTGYAHSAVWVGIANMESAPAETLWAQMGYMKLRETIDPGGYRTYMCRYFEVKAGKDDGEYLFVFDSTAGEFPLEGESHLYQIDLNPLSGVWEATVDGFCWFETAQYADVVEGWFGRAGTLVEWAGEIYGLESDMAGTAGNPDTIGNCALSAGYYQPANIYGASLGTTDASEWMIRAFAQSSLVIWDVIPQ